MNRAYKKRLASPAYKKLIKDLSPKDREIVDRELDYCRYPKDWPVKGSNSKNKAPRIFKTERGPEVYTHNLSLVGKLAYSYRLSYLTEFFSQRIFVMMFETALPELRKYCKGKAAV